MIEKAIEFKKAVRIGVNWGSLDGDLSARLMDENAARAEPWGADAVTREALVQSALMNAEKAIKIGLPAEKIILSAKVGPVRPDRCLPRAGETFELCAASRLDRSRDGNQRNYCHSAGGRNAVAGRDRRYDPCIINAGTGRRPDD